MKSTIYEYVDGGWSAPFDTSVDGENSVVLIFADSDVALIEKPLKEVSDAYPKAVFMGASGAGMIIDDMIGDGILSVMVIQFEKTRVQLHYQEVKESQDSLEAGYKLADSFDKKGLKSLFVLSDGLHVNGSKLAEGMGAVLGGEVVITGGLAGDGDSFEKTWILVDRVPREHYICALGLYGEAIEIGYGTGGGWQQIGPLRTITKSEENTLYEIDQKPALGIYKEYLGERAQYLPASGLLFPIKLIGEDGNSKIRTVLAINEEDQSITFAGDLPEGSTISLTTSNFSSLVEGASYAAGMIDTEKFDTIPSKVSIAISCVGRKLVMKQRTEDELEAVKETLGEDTQQIGFYSYGEISPANFGKCDLHNQTMTLTVLGEY